MYAWITILTILSFLNSGFAVTDRPIIGILSQGISSSLDDMLPDGHNFTTYIAASYVKWVEAAGARAVPIIVNGDTEYYEKIYSGINGLLIPGGAVSIYSSPYAEASRHLMDLAQKDNDQFEVFPIWATCLGFETVATITNNGEPLLKRCNSYDQALPLELVEGWEFSTLLGQADSEIISDLTSMPVTANFHHWCLTPENFTRFELDKFWNILSTNEDSDGVEFISTIEAQDYPFYGTQFHPEKNQFEWAPKYPNIPHSSEGIQVGQYFGEFFIGQARRSNHKFESRSEEEKYLIYNYQPFYSGPEGRNFGFQQVYVF